MYLDIQIENQELSEKEKNTLFEQKIKENLIFELKRIVATRDMLIMKMKNELYNF